MTCAKVFVECRLYAKGKMIARGTNACANPQDECPRLPGEGYEKCTTICGQRGHAEIQALANMAGRQIPAGVLAEIRGHTYVCRECQEALFGAGVAAIGVCK